MIIEFIMNVVFSLLGTLFSALPNVAWNVNEGLLGTFFDLLDVALYIFPMGTVVAILTIVVSMQTFKIVIAIVKTIWDLLPFV